MPRSSIILFSFLSLQINAWSQNNIAEARAFAVGATVTVSGIVTNGLELGPVRYLQDETAGIAIYDTDVSHFQRGDQVTVTGKLYKFYQLLEVTNLSSFTVISSGNQLPVPQLITIHNMGELLEGEMVRINQVNFINAGGYFNGNTNYNFTSAGETGQVRIVTGSGLVGQLIPTSSVDLTGILSQFHYSDPNNGYQLLLRNQDDIILPQTIAFTSPLRVAGLITTGFSLFWETSQAGSTQVFYGNTPAFELGVFSVAGDPNTVHHLTFGGLSPSSLIYLKAFSVKDGDTALSGTRAVITQSMSGGNIKVYFTSSVDHSVASEINAIQLDDAVDDTLISYINRARQTLDIAIYNFGVTGLSDIPGAINNAYNRGVQVRIVANGNTTNLGIGSLDPGIPKIFSPTGTSDGIMHNKFMVIDAFSIDPDDPVVWTGSANWTSGNINTDANNVIVIQDQSLAIAYTLEFEEMWGSSGQHPSQANARFGPAKLDNTPHEFIIDGKEVSLYFSPSDGVNQRIIEAIKEAGKNIAVNTMLITRPDIAYTLADQKNAGVATRVIVNKEEDCSESVVSMLKSSLGNDFRRFGEPGLLHSKCLIVDHAEPAHKPLVIAGSHNWSSSANDKNDENTLAIYDASISNIFYQEFMARFNNGVALSMKDITKDRPVLKIYPNPSSGYLNVDLDKDFLGHISLRLYDHFGLVVFQINEERSFLMGNKLDLSDLRKGLYFMEITVDHVRYIEKLILIH